LRIGLMVDTFRDLFRCHCRLRGGAQPQGRRSKAQEVAVVADQPKVAFPEAHGVAPSSISAMPTA
jgi:hypothetical protein